ncbi:hypothetical protein M2337_002582 [Sphingobium sp. B2D3A]|uniref:hypothetical protein n=1 Tax=unclassified Sphingobium TaxID=2611147 RepID=UPI0022257CD0|nr:MULTISPECIES: hypothetical protein [unclassified Sphingobium]MCW2338349.1 hypothetical protein [Sphingobium sp. B2D3A]MCW2384807.1 hypothetical protein [Sphingobium sp. B2D3D]
MSRFRHFAAIDWSGAQGPRQPGIAVAICDADSGAGPALVRPGHIWSRQDVLDWMRKDMPRDTLVGLDLGPSLPFADKGAFFPGWDRSPPDARQLWALVEDICAEEPHLGAGAFVDHPEAARHFRRHGAREGDLFGGGRGRLRQTELAQQAQGLNPCSNLNLVGAAQVGKSSLTGMRVLHRIQADMPVWPFDADPGSGSLIVEIYTSLAALAAGKRKGQTKVREAELDACLARLASGPHVRFTGRYSDHATDALLSAAWLRLVHREPALWAPQALTPELARTEGWTFGVL